jgi:glycosyltransferase involved in cell wall biosynthesis
MLGFVNGHGGDAVQMGELAVGLAQRGHPVKVIVPLNEWTAEFAQRFGDRVPVERSPLLARRQGVDKQHLGQLVRLLWPHRATAVHVHTGDVCPPRTGLLALQAARPRRAIATIHCPYPFVEARSARGRFWAWSAERCFSAVVSPSWHGRATQLDLGVPGRVLRHIPNGVDVARYAKGDPSRPRRELGMSPTDPLAVFTSRLEPQKQPGVALEAFAAVAGDAPTARLAFVGEGALEGDLQARVRALGLERRVHFMGHRSDVPDWLAASTLWTLPTEAENFSLAVLEALAAGCAIVSTHCTGNDEVLVDGRNAVLHHIDGHDAAAAFRRVLTDAPLRHRLATAAKETAARYDVDAMVDAYEHLLLSSR